jgi:hypothetical protein
MNDRRVYSLLIVDPDVKDHETRIKNLASRQLIRKRNTKQIHELIEKKKPLIKMVACARKKNFINEQPITISNNNNNNTEDGDEDKMSVLNKMADDLNSSEYEIDSSSNDSFIDSGDEKNKQMIEEQRIKSKNRLSTITKKSTSMHKNVSVLTEDQGEKVEKKKDESMFN